MVSSSEYNEPCETDEKCIKDYTPQYQCIQNHCQRKSFTFDNWREITGAIVVVIISMFANAGGLGAGAVIIPVYVFIYGFYVTDSIPLSKITIFAGAISNIMFIWNDRRPQMKSRFLISYEMAATMIPLLLCGTMIGVYLSKLLPALVITVCLCLYLFYSVYKMFHKAMELTRKENAALKIAADVAIKDQETKEKQIIDSNNEPKATNMITDDDYDRSGNDTNVQTMIEEENNVDRSLIKEEENTSTCFLMKEQGCNYAFLLGSYVMVIVIALLRGGEGFKSVVGIPECSIGTWSLLAVSQLIGFAMAVGSYKYNRAAYKAEDGTDVTKFQQRRKIIYMSYITGIAAGTLGIGGGMILGPFMLALGMDPQISTALSGFTVLFTSSSTSTQFTIAGAIHIEHAWVLMIFSLIGSLIGNLALKKLIAYYKRPSFVVWVIFGILLLATFVLPGQAIYDAITKPGALNFNFNAC